MKTTNYLKNAPLPFQGQKRMFVKQFVDLLNDIKQQQKISTIVDLFGGSGLLSHISKRLLPHCKVIYNDYDNFSERLKNISRTNEILEQFRLIAPPSQKGETQKMDSETKAKILEIVKQASNKGFVDYITLSASILFSGNYVTSLEQLEKMTMYNTIRKSNFNECQDYLEGIEVTHCDYLELYKQYKDREDVLFLVDPPYLSTDTQSYNSDKYWKLSNYLDVLLTLINTNYIFFTSNKSQLVELCQWFNSVKLTFDNPFAQSNTSSHSSYVTHNAKYTDIMLWKL